MCHLTLGANDARRQERHGDRECCGAGEDRRQGNRVLERAGTERGDAVTELVRGNQPTGGNGHELGERGLAVSDRHREEPRTGETGQREDDDPVRLVGERRGEQQCSRDAPRQHEVDDRR